MAPHPDPAAVALYNALVLAPSRTDAIAAIHRALHRARHGDPAMTEPPITPATLEHLRVALAGGRVYVLTRTRSRRERSDRTLIVDLKIVTPAGRIDSIAADVARYYGLKYSSERQGLVLPHDAGTAEAIVRRLAATVAPERAMTIEAL